MSEFQEQHPPEVDLHAYLDHELTEGQARAVAEHVANCDQCRQTLAGIEELFAQIESLSDQALNLNFVAGIEARLELGRPGGNGWRWMLAAQLAGTALLAWLALPTLIQQGEYWLSMVAGWIARLSLGPELRTLLGMIRDLPAQLPGGLPGVLDISLPVYVALPPALGWWVLLGAGALLWLIVNRWLLSGAGDLTAVNGHRA
jgi:NAD(P)-dependent dehydrogenase (short-subunit alcohol dehydrogenase family)